MQDRGTESTLVDSLKGGARASWRCDRNYCVEIRKGKWSEWDKSLRVVMNISVSTRVPCEFIFNGSSTFQSISRSFQARNIISYRGTPIGLPVGALNFRRWKSPVPTHQNQEIDQFYFYSCFYIVFSINRHFEYEIVYSTFFLYDFNFFN